MGGRNGRAVKLGRAVGPVFCVTDSGPVF